MKFQHWYPSVLWDMGGGRVDDALNIGLQASTSISKTIWALWAAVVLWQLHSRQCHSHIPCWICYVLSHFPVYHYLYHVWVTISTPILHHTSPQSFIIPEDIILIQTTSRFQHPPCTQQAHSCWNCAFTVLCLIICSLYLFVHIPYLATAVRFSPLFLSCQVALWTLLLSFLCGETGILTGYEPSSMLCQHLLIPPLISIISTHPPTR